MKNQHLVLPLEEGVLFLAETVLSLGEPVLLIEIVLAPCAGVLLAGVAEDGKTATCAKTRKRTEAPILFRKDTPLFPNRLESSTINTCLPVFKTNHKSQQAVH